MAEDILERRIVEEEFAGLQYKWTSNINMKSDEIYSLGWGRSAVLRSLSNLRRLRFVSAIISICSSSTES